MIYNEVSNKEQLQTLITSTLERTESLILSPNELNDIYDSLINTN
ncbi:Uncharacterised protein [Mycoplasmopsis edwardii]|uniref:Uncharacterized protein n=1 Tax=Mycoplasmopsis edwardii TaxID=53558 RepID=A0A3B0PPQ5_9BACT|nr:hypothetical protein [Mycoplasmopsis edwardii]SYV97670.1 Uncharacterised protein [Mycoplasmopsis edwardii]